MKLVMLKRGNYEVQENDGTLVHVIKQYCIPVNTPWRNKRIWRIDVPRDRNNWRKLPGDFKSLTAALASLKFKYTNYPGPLKVLEKLNNG